MLRHVGRLLLCTWAPLAVEFLFAQLPRSEREEGWRGESLGPSCKA